MFFTSGEPCVTVLFGGKSLCAHAQFAHFAHLKCGELCTSSFRVERLHEFSGILLHRKSLFPHLFTYAIIYLPCCGLVDTCFILWFITQYYWIYLVAQIVSSLAFGNFPAGSHVPLTYPDFIYFIFSAFFFLCWLYNMFQVHLIDLSAVILEPSVSPRSFCFSRWWKILEVKI